MRIFITPGKKQKMKKSKIQSRNLFRVVGALKDAGELNVGYKDSPWMSQATVWSDDNTGRHEQICMASDQNLVPRATIL